MEIAYWEMSVPICNLMNTCNALTKTFPAPLMSADVSPIFKDGDDMNKGNFRLVSILLMTKYVIIFVRYLMHYYLPVGDITVVRQ